MYHTLFIFILTFVIFLLFFFYNYITIFNSIQR